MKESIKTFFWYVMAYSTLIFGCFFGAAIITLPFQFLNYISFWFGAVSFFIVFSYLLLMTRLKIAKGSFLYSIRLFRPIEFVGDAKTLFDIHWATFTIPIPFLKNEETSEDSD